MVDIETMSTNEQTSSSSTNLASRPLQPLATTNYPNSLQKLSTFSKSQIPPLNSSAISSTGTIDPKPELAMKSPTLTGMANVIAQRVQQHMKQQNKTLPMLLADKSVKRKFEESPTAILDNDFYMFSDNAKRYLNDQTKLMMSPRRTKSPQQKLKTSFDNFGYSYGDIIARRSSLQRVQTAKSLLEELEEEKLDQLKPIFRRSRAETLLRISEGTSQVSQTAPNVSYYLNNYEQFVRSDSQMSRRSSIIGASSTPLYSGRSSRRNSARNVISRPTSGASSGRSSATIFQQASSEEQFIDPTLRTYTSSPTGRKVNTIYHPFTKQPSQIDLFMDKSSVTNETLYTFITTEFVDELDLEHCHWISNRILESIGQFCQQLAILNLQHCIQLVDRTIIVIANGCPNITSLNVGYVFNHVIQNNL